MLRLIVSAVVVMCLSGCGSDSPGGTVGEPVLVLPLKVEQAPTEKQDSFSTRELAISGDWLILKVTYGGGCEEHVFGFSWDGIFAESIPTQAQLTILHEAYGDRCFALINKTLHVDLTPVKERWQEQYRSEHGAIDLHIAGLTDPVRYTF